MAQEFRRFKNNAKQGNAYTPNQTIARLDLHNTSLTLSKVQGSGQLVLFHIRPHFQKLSLRSKGVELLKSSIFIHVQSCAEG